jgi:hypothetical protein
MSALDDAPATGSKPARKQAAQQQKIAPSTVTTLVTVESPAADVDPWARGNRLRKDSWGLVMRRVWADFSTMP